MTAQQAGRAFPQSEFALRPASRWSYRAPNTLSDSAVCGLHADSDRPQRPEKCEIYVNCAEVRAGSSRWL
ncbi:hypothetical protein K523DRAFT_358681 [Schizophyllum commune Tattone D]|nr:hypothetical protein K523DRAFT_358681 [Schizophyllum commune Tattone D]